MTTVRLLCLLIAATSLAPCARAHGAGDHLRFNAGLDWTMIAGLSPLDAVLRVLDLPEPARRLLREPAPPTVPMMLPLSPAHPVSGAVVAGAAAVPLELPEEVRGWPLGGTPGRMWLLPDPEHDPHGLGRLLAASRGVRDPLRAKALSLVVDGHRVVWISVDTCMVPEHLVALIQDKLAAHGVRPDLLLASATHTHSGPGAINPRPFVWMAMDLHDARLSGRVADWCVRAVLAAVRAEQPALLGWGAVDVSGLVVNRRNAAQEAARSFDLLRVLRRDGSALAALVLGPMHATMLDEKNLYFSADVAGTIERGLESRLGAGAVAMLVQGAEGDQSPLIHYGEESEEAAMERIGDDLAGRAAAALSSVAVDATTTLDWRTVRWTPPRASLRPGLHDPRIPRMITIPLGKLAEPGGVVTGLRIGDRALATVPGEPILALGNQIRQLGEDLGAGPTRVCGLTNGYVGYIATPEEYDKGGYEAVATLYGARTAASLLAACNDVLRDLTGTRAPRERPFTEELERRAP